MHTLLGILFTLISHGHATETFTSGYRILHSSPQEIVSALVQPQPRMTPNQAAGSARGRAASRMQKYFRIRKKTIEGQTITIEVAPELPLLSTEFADSNLIILTFTETAHTQDKFTYAVKIRTSAEKYLDTTMTIEPHISGSLLTLRLKNPSLLSQTFAQAALGLGFLERSPQAAEAKDR